MSGREDIRNNIPVATKTFDEIQHIITSTSTIFVDVLTNEITILVQLTFEFYYIRRTVFLRIL